MVCRLKRKSVAGSVRFRESCCSRIGALSGPAILQISSYWKPGEVITIEAVGQKPSRLAQAWSDERLDTGADGHRRLCESGSHRRRCRYARSCRLRRWKRRKCRDCSSWAKWWMLPASSAGSTFSGPGLRGMRPGRRCESFSLRGFAQKLGEAFSPPKLGGQHDRDAVEIVRGVVPKLGLTGLLGNHPSRDTSCRAALLT